MTHRTSAVWPLLVIITFVGALVVNFYENRDEKMKTLSDQYRIQITPADWAFSIWGVIYIWQTLWMLYLFFYGCMGGFRSVPFPMSFYVWFILSNIFNGLWIMLWTQKMLIWSAITSILLTWSLFMSLLICHRYLRVTVPSYESSDDMEARGHKLSPETKSLLYILVLNGIAFYTVWIFFAMCLNLGIVFRYKTFHLSDNWSSIIALIILTLGNLFAWSLDFIFLHKCFQYTFASYPPLLVALIGILSRYNWNVQRYQASVIFSFVLFIICCIVFIIKLLDGLRACMMTSPSSNSYDKKIPQYEVV